MRNSFPLWNFLDELDVPGFYQSQIGGFSIVSQTLYRRGHTSLADAQGFLDPDHYVPASPMELPGLPETVKRLQQAVSNRDPVLVWGDFDVDGQTATTLLVSALRQLNVPVAFYIPNRATESHGISLSSLQNQLQIHSPSLLLTCDTGIDAVESISYAQSQGVDALITDHHQLPPDLPSAAAIVNPNLLDSSHPLFSLPGVGVAYKIIQTLFNQLDLDSDSFLDLVSLGIVADVAHLSGDTRYLLQRGLSVLRNTPRLGLQQLFHNAGLEPSEITEEHIGFVIGPRLNALGRLDDANSCIEFFTTDNIKLAAKLANRLEDLNNQRQLLTETIYNDTLEQLDSHPYLLSDFPVLVLDGPASWHPGVIGIVASRLVDQFHKPVVMLSRDGNMARGSARSVNGVSISELLIQTSDLLDSFGGHPMAAGLTLSHENISRLRRKLRDSFIQLVGDALPAPELSIDATLPFSVINLEYIDDIYRLAPFGAGNPPLLFAVRGATIMKNRLIGKNLNHRKITVSDSTGYSQDMLWWNSSEQDIPPGPIDIAFTLGKSTYRDQEQVQLTVKHIRSSPRPVIQLTENKSTSLVDKRNHPAPLQELTIIAENDPEAVIWAEFKKPEHFSSQPRLSLPESSTLVIWTSPPSKSVLNSVLQSVSPQNVIIFGINPIDHHNRTIIEAILGMLRHLDSTGKKFDASLFAQSIAQTTAVIHAGLDWIHQHGDFDLSRLYSENLILPGPGKPLPEFVSANNNLNLLLQESSAYRAYFLTADPDYLL